MSTSAQAVPVQIPAPRHRHHLPSVPEAFAMLLSLMVIALFCNTFVLQPFLIPSESMERTLLVGDFLLVNKQIYAQPGTLSRYILPYREVERGDIIIFHHPQPHPYLVKRVVGIPGDHLRIAEGHVYINGVEQSEPYAAFEPVAGIPTASAFPQPFYNDPQIDSLWWRQMPDLIRNGELVVPAGQYFVLGDNRNNSLDSRFWGFVPRSLIIARPTVIYFSLRRPSTTDIQQAADDRLGHNRELSARITGFARWKRIFQVVH